MNTKVRDNSDLPELDKPYDLLRQYINLAPSGKALELAASEGQNVFFMADRGHEVTVVDSSQEKIEKLLKLADKKNIRIDFRNTDLLEFKANKSQFAVINMKSVLIHLSKTEGAKLIENLIYGLKKGALLIGTVLTTDDPSCKEMLKKKAELIEANCFRLPNGWIYSYYKHREILELIPSLQVLYYSENEYYKRGSAKSRWYGVAEFVFKKI